MERLYDYNHTRPSEHAKRAQLLKEMLAECGAGCWIEPPFHANWGGKHVHLSDYVYANFGLTSFGFDHNFDHNAKDFIWSIAGIGGLFERNIICCDMRASVDANDLKSWLAIISAVPSNFQAENASLNNWIALCRMDS